MPDFDRFLAADDDPAAAPWNAPPSAARMDGRPGTANGPGPGPRKPGPRPKPSAETAHAELFRKL
jgi:hypothetical protein